MTNTNLRKLICTSALCSTLAAAAAQKPNIIFIMTDQHTAGALSCAGNTDLHTPNIDRIAKNGVRFVNAYCTAPLSGPSRTAMFTGYFPESVGMSSNNDAMQDSLKTRTLGNLVDNAGYECAYAGKWHVPEVEIPDSIYGFRRIHGHDDNGLAEACTEFLSARHDRPFFLVASYDNPHNICEFARSQNLPYGNIEMADIADCPGLPANFSINPYDSDVLKFERQQNFALYPTVNYTADDWRRYRYTYNRLVEKVDAEIGKIIDVIDRKNLWENTVVIFTSDHGDGYGAHNWNQKSALYEEVVNIPLIVSLPGKKNAGLTTPQLVSNGVDIFASICDWADVEKPASTRGKSFRAAVEKADAGLSNQDFVVCETRFDNSKTRGWMLRSGKFKYVLYDKGRFREQLYDMTADRGETRNLAVEKKYADVLQQHRDMLARWMKDNKVAPSRKKLHDVPGKEL